MPCSIRRTYHRLRENKRQHCGVQDQHCDDAVLDVTRLELAMFETELPREEEKAL